jgi:hypothetical protein
MSGQPEHDKLDSDCTPPPDHPLPADQLGRYSPERDFFAEKEIAEYVEGQARGEEAVQNVERVKTEYVMGTPYGEASPFDEVIRRQVQAADRLERAIEAVDFQAVGMQLRECLISLVGAARRRVELEENDDRPKDADVVGWNRVLIGKLCPGEKNDELRSYMKALVEKAWPLVNWLTHHRNANKTAALVSLDGVDAIVKHYVRLLSRERADRTDQCPRCASRNVRTFFDIAIAPNGAYFEACGECGWDGHPAYPEDDDEVQDEAEVAEAPHD